MTKWIEVAEPADVPEGEKRCASAGQHDVIVCHIDGEWFAAENVCPHAGMPLGEGDLYGSNIVCPFHGYTYNLKTGKNVDWPDDVPLTTLPIRVEGDRVEVQVDAEE